MLWFGFGYKGFGQVALGEDLISSLPEVVKLKGAEVGDSMISRVIPSWSYTAFLTEDGSVLLSGFVGGCHVPYLCLPGIKCLDLLPTENVIILQFTDCVKCWAVNTLSPLLMHEKSVWKMDTCAGHNVAFPLVANGHIIPQAPFFRQLPTKCSAHKLVLGNEHVVLITTEGTLLTWGAGRHGQLGHGDLEDVQDPRIVDALHGVVMVDAAAGGWHSVGLSEGGDIYCWGWNESGQLGLPSKALAQEKANTEEAPTGADPAEASEFITIQAFPALIDLPHESEVIKISCGSRHTAAVTGSGDLYTWGWGKYGQLGHGNTMSLDHPQRVEYFSQNQLCVKEVSCKHWKTYVRCHQKIISAGLNHNDNGATI
ncbi:RCC1 domain-containing protein 1 [Bombina bombina]|uniref:RCC1 domain-containing protein 1 n=1 Tax=Bombina bombina TaxID=8345 RepID=UPI00235AA087|nr:RCC1 domain-containing protein 1 [Bombina bombina]